MIFRATQPTHHSTSSLLPQAAACVAFLVIIMNGSRRLYEKNTTFTRRPGVPQVASYLVFSLETVLFYAVVLPRLDSSPQAAFGVLYSLSLLALVVTTITASACDPSDRVMVQHRNCSREEFDEWRRGCGIKLLFCDYCRSFVKERSRHCRACDRCVEDFDHHCMWINNCVGGLNYRAFFAMILAAFSNLLLYVLALLVLTLQPTPAANFLPAFAAAWASGGINSIFVFLLINLIILHLYLLNKGISTYEFIMAQREQERKQKEQENKLKELPRVDSLKIAHEQLNAPEQGTNDHVEVKQEDSSSDNVVRVRSFDKRQEEGSSELSSNHHAQRESIEEKPLPPHKSVIFGQDGLTEKSENWEGQERVENDESEGESSVELSQLFTRNKSLKFIIGKNEFYRPHRTSRDDNRASKSKSMFVRQ